MIREHIGFWKIISDPRDPRSFSVRSRRRRMAFFNGLLASVPRPLRILDVGGTEVFWETMGLAGASDVEIVLLNVDRQEVRWPNLKSLPGDARDLAAFRMGEFDVVFSNSVIEHVGDFDMQKKMADEVRRVGRRYFIQTPNFYFPLEPHFLFPFFQFLPPAAKVFLIRHFNLGWYNKIPDAKEAAELAVSIRLLTERELHSLFPGGRLFKEKFLGITKSFIIYDGWSS